MVRQATVGSKGMARDEATGGDIRETEGILDSFKGVGAEWELAGFAAVGSER
jgi:hypothetical protein